MPPEAPSNLFRKKDITIGKLRGLQQCATERDVFCILALDHRNNLRVALNLETPANISDDQLIAIKQELATALGKTSSAVLLDPEFGAYKCIATGAMPGERGLIVALEATGYEGNRTARQSRILPDWGVEKALRMGASAVKLLVYYHPNSPQAQMTEELVAETSERCRASDLAFFVEPLSYSLDPQAKKLDPASKRRVVIETARRLTPLGIDVLKAEFPAAASDAKDEIQWGEACAELSAASLCPWVLLSAGVSYDMYLHQVEIACRNGASGVVVGRAVWQEVLETKGQARSQFLKETARRRLQDIRAVCETFGRPFTDFYVAEHVQPDWYVSY
jgi:tagatose 1,6-diphosphate aldolase